MDGNNSERARKLNIKPDEFLKEVYLLVQPDGSAPNGDQLAAVGFGGSGIVYRARQILYEKIFVDRAIKFFVYRDDIALLPSHSHMGPISSEDFIIEVKSTSRLSHESIVRIIDAGALIRGEEKIPYIVTDLISGPTLRDVLNSKDSKEISDIRQQWVHQPVRVLDLLTRLADAIKYIHEQGFLHCDIAPKNVYLDSSRDWKPLLGDLGNTREVFLERDSIRIVGSREYMPPHIRQLLDQSVPGDEFKEFYPDWDVYSFGKLGLRVLEGLGLPESISWVRALRSAFEYACDNCAEVDIAHLVDRLHFLQPIHRELASVPELSSTVANASKKLMPVEGLRVTSRVNKLLAHPALMRLSRVPQLTTVNQLFPGAGHNRYEHSLGVMETARRYFMRLVDQGEFLEHLSVSKIEKGLLCALLSNSTRFPFSNIVHEIRNEDSSRLAAFSHTTLYPRVLEITDRNGETIVSQIERLFPQVRIQDVSDILLSNRLVFDEGDRILWSILNSSLDVRVVDFVRRDALHIGLTSGASFDLDELLRHLTIHKHKLAIRSTGAAIAEEIIALRYWLFSRVYWNRPNRALCSMIRHVLHELDTTNDGLPLNELANQLLDVDESSFLSLLSESCGATERPDLKSIVDMLRTPRQRIYKTALDLARREDVDLRAALIRTSEMNFADLAELGSIIEDSIPELTRESHELPPSVIVDVPSKADANKLGDDIIVIRPDGVATSLAEYSGIVDGINNNFLESLLRVRVFIHPDVWHRCEGNKSAMQAEIRAFLETQV
jgi:HD superfamily phosphohydrolase